MSDELFRTRTIRGAIESAKIRSLFRYWRIAIIRNTMEIGDVTRPSRTVFFVYLTTILFSLSFSLSLLFLFIGDLI